MQTWIFKHNQANSILRDRVTMMVCPRSHRLRIRNALMIESIVTQTRRASSMSDRRPAFHDWGIHIKLKRLAVEECLPRMHDYRCLLKYEMDVICERCLWWFMTLLNATCSSVQCLGGLIVGAIILDGEERSKAKANYLRAHHNYNHQTFIRISHAASNLEDVGAKLSQDVHSLATSPWELQWRRQALPQRRLSRTDVPCRQSANILNL